MRISLRPESAMFSQHTPTNFRMAIERAVVRVTLLAALGALSPAVGIAQGLLIAPNAIVIDSRTKSGSVTLVNPGAKPVEAILSTSYAYPATDRDGSMFLKSVETVDDTMPSARDWVRIYPSRLVLPAGARRTVRLMVEPPATLPAREFWARLIVTSREAQQALPAESDDASSNGGDMSIGLTLELRSVLGLFYRNGEVRTGAQLDSARTQIVGDSLVSRVRMRRDGNAAFVGSLRVSVRDATGTVRRQRELPLGVYYDLHPRVALERGDLPDGEYTVVFEAISSRPDVAARLLLPIAKTQTELRVRLP